MLLITGWPGVGKTTAVRAVAERLRARGARVDGFVTLERRDAATGVRVGFDAVNLDGSRRAPLAIAKARAQHAATTPRVGKYAVDVESFESVALSIIERSHDVDVLVVDEIGKMELLSPRFERAMRFSLGVSPLSHPLSTLVQTAAALAAVYFALPHRLPLSSLSLSLGSMSFFFLLLHHHLHHPPPPPSTSATIHLHHHHPPPHLKWNLTCSTYFCLNWAVS